MLRRRHFWIALLVLGLDRCAQAEILLEPGEEVITNTVAALNVRFGPGNAQVFTNLHVEVLNSRLHMFCVLPVTNLKSFKVFYTLGPEGHWNSRDWRSFPATLKGETWDAIIPIETLDLPFFYFVQVDLPDGKSISPLHKIDPDGLGMKSPTQPFWGFIEGFEQGLEGWFPTGKENPMSLVSSPVKTGKSALQLSIPAKRNSVSVYTTRIRGAQILLTGSIGITLQARTKTKARLRFTIFERRGEPNQRLLQFPEEVELDKTWKTIELPLSGFRDAHLLEVDSFGIEAIGEPLTEVFIDDINLVIGSITPQQLEINPP